MNINFPEEESMERINVYVKLKRLEADMNPGNARSRRNKLISLRNSILAELGMGSAEDKFIKSADDYISEIKGLIELIPFGKEVKGQRADLLSIRNGLWAEFGMGPAKTREKPSIESLFDEIDQIFETQASRSL